VRLGHVRAKAPTRPRQLGHEGSAGHHRGLFHGHGHQHLAAVHLEVDGHAQGQRVQAHHIFDHVVGLRGRQPAAAIEGGALGGAEAGPVRGRLAALGQRLLIEAR
jgi:hypothetical protein